VPIIQENAWSSEHKWLRVKRLKFIPIPGDTTGANLLYKSAATLTYDTGVDPGAAIIMWNNVNPSLVTQLAISKTDRNAADQTAAISNIHIGDSIFVQETTDRRFTVEATDIPVDLGTWFQVNVAYLTSAGAIVKNRDLNVDLTYYPQTWPQGADRLEIHMAQEWPWVLYRIFDDGSEAIIPYVKGMFPMSDIRAIEIKSL